MRQENDKTGYTYGRDQLGDMLCRQREAMGISQEEMAKKLGVSVQAINLIEGYDADNKIQPILEAYGVAIRANVFTSASLGQLYAVRREPITKADLKTWNKIEKLIRRAVAETWFMEAQKVLEEQE